MENKTLALQHVAQEIEQCDICKQGKTGKMVFGEGSPNATVMFVGEAPGKQEAATGRPFVGRSGKLLRSFIAEIGLSDQEVYITSPVKYLPISGTPSQADIEHAKPYFDKQVAIINPSMVILMGAVAARAALSRPIPVKKMHGEVLHENGRTYVITLHPAAALRFPPLKKIVEEDFEKIKKLVKYPKESKK